MNRVENSSLSSPGYFQGGMDWFQCIHCPVLRSTRYSKIVSCRNAVGWPGDMNNCTGGTVVDRSWVEERALCCFQQQPGGLATAQDTHLRHQQHQSVLLALSLIVVLILTLSGPHTRPAHTPGDSTAEGGSKRSPAELSSCLSSPGLGHRRGIASGKRAPNGLYRQLTKRLSLSRTAV